MTIAVVIATYNGALFIREQLDSVLNQTLLPNEIVVCDDNSADNTWEIIEEYNQKYPKLFKIYQNKERKGPHKNFKSAFNYTTSDLIAPCDQDDIWFPEKLERSVRAIEDGYDYVLCQESIQYELSGTHKVYHSMPTLKESIFGCPVNGHLIVFRRELLKAFTISPEITFDWGILLMAASRGTGVAIDYVGCIWRRHKNAVTSEYSDYGDKHIVKGGKWYKFFQTLKLLLRGEKSPVITKRMISNSQIINSVEKKTKTTQIAYKVTLSMSKQNSLSHLMASFNYLRLNAKEGRFIRLSIKEKIGSSLYAFCYPSIWWYDYHNHDAL